MSHMNTYATVVGDRYRDADGNTWRVTRIAEPGTMGIAYSAGPRVTIALEPNLNLSREVQHGGYYQPQDYELIDVDYDTIDDDRLDHTVELIEEER